MKAHARMCCLCMHVCVRAESMTVWLCSLRACLCTCHHYDCLAAFCFLRRLTASCPACGHWAAWRKMHNYVCNVCVSLCVCLSVSLCVLMWLACLPWQGWRGRPRWLPGQAGKTAAANAGCGSCLSACLSPLNVTLLLHSLPACHTAPAWRAALADRPMPASAWLCAREALAALAGLPCKMPARLSLAGPSVAVQPALSVSLCVPLSVCLVSA